MPTLERMLAQVRTVWLDEPLPQQPPVPYLFGLLLAEVQNGVNQIANTSQNIETREASFTVNASQEDALLNAADIGKPLVVYTVDSANPHHSERVVDLVQEQNLVMGYEGTRDGAGRHTYLYPPEGNSWHVAQKMSIFQRNGAWYVRSRPVPPSDAQSAEYKLIYSVGDWTETAGLGSPPILTQFSQLFEVRTALAALSKAAWCEDDEMNGAKRKELGVLRTQQEMRYSRNFDAYVASINGRRVTVKRSNW